MMRRLLPCVALLGLVALPTAARPAEEKKAATPGLVIRVQSLDELMSNFRYLAGLVGREEEAKQFEGMLQAKAGGPKGLEGIDAKRPLAVYGTFGEGGPETSSAVGLIPIADEKAFLGLIENLGAKAEKDKDGVYEVTGEALKQATTIYFRFANKYAYVTALNKDALDKDKLLPPSAVLPADKKTPVLSVQVRIDQVPENLRNVAAAQVETQLDNAKEEKPEGETPAQHAAKVEITDQIKKGFVSLIKDGGELALRLDVDQGAKEVTAEVSLSGKDGTPLAKSIAAFGRHTSAVAGLIGAESVLSAVVNLPVDEKLAAALQSLVKDELHKGIAKQGDAAKKEQTAKIVKAIEPALKFTDFDAALDLRGPGKGGLYTLVGGQKLADGAAVDKAIRDVVKDLPEKDRSAIKLDADKAGAVAIHSITTMAADANFKKSFGEGPAYLAVRPDAAFLAVGDGALDALKEVLKVEPKVGKPLQIEVSVSRLADLMGREQPEAPKAAAKAFANDKGADKVRFSLEAGRELKLRLVLKTPVLTFFHLMEPGATK
jgi:hypothetical protein